MASKLETAPYVWGDCTSELDHSSLRKARIQYVIENFDREHAIRDSAQTIEGASAEVLETLRKVDSQRAFNSLLTYFLHLTESSFGFIGSILQDENGKDYMLSHAISNIAWDGPSKKFFLENAPKGMEFRNHQSLFGHAIVTRNLVISNDPKTDPKSGGTPPGHPTLRCFMAIPFLDGDKMIGMVGIANRPGGYRTEDVAYLSDLIDFSRGVLQYFQAKN